MGQNSGAVAARQPLLFFLVEFVRLIAKPKIYNTTLEPDLFMKSNYQQEVVNPGDLVSKLAHQICIESHGNCPAVKVFPLQKDNFRGMVGYQWNTAILYDMCEGARSGNWKYLQVPQNDGAGGKPQFFTLRNDLEAWQNLGWEIITMCADDLGCRLCLPAIMMNQLDVKQVTDENFPAAEAVLQGYGQALKKARIVNLTGETAIMKNSITAFCDLRIASQLVLTWGAGCIGLAHKERYVDGASITAGMPIVGIHEKGYRCNGGTFFTDLLAFKWRKAYKIMDDDGAMAFVSKLTAPSESYAASLCRIGGWNPNGTICDPLAKIHGAAHITGGGVWKKFDELLPREVGADLSSMPEPPEVLLEGQRMSFGTPFSLSDYDAYGDLNGGVGMLVVVEPGDEDTLISELQRDGHTASVVGKTIVHKADYPGRIRIQSRFFEGKELWGPLPE